MKNFNFRRWKLELNSFLILSNLQVTLISPFVGNNIIQNLNETKIFQAASLTGTWRTLTRRNSLATLIPGCKAFATSTCTTRSTGTRPRWWPPHSATLSRSRAWLGAICWLSGFLKNWRFLKIKNFLLKEIPNECPVNPSWISYGNRLESATTRMRGVALEINSKYLNKYI